MDQGSNAAMLSLFAAAGLGFVVQWAMFAPKNVPTWAAWSALGAATIVLYWWSNPTAIADFHSNWRIAIVGIIQFFLTAKGTGSAAKGVRAAPATNSL